MSDNIRRRMDQLEHMIATNQIGAAGVFTQMRQLVQAAQSQASKPIAAVHGWFHGECVIRALDPEAVLPAGMALYSQPQAQAGDGEAVGKVYYTGRGFLDVDWFTSDIPDDALLYTAPPPAAVNQQLLEALLEHFVAARFAIDTGMKGTALNCINAGIDAIAAAQEVGNE